MSLTDPDESAPLRWARWPAMAWLFSLAVTLFSCPTARADQPPGKHVRVAILHTGELLRSESRAFAETEKSLINRRWTVHLSDASAVEQRIAASWFTDPTNGSPPALPPEWSQEDLVLVVQVLPPEGQKPNRISHGIGSILAFAPPRTAPFYLQLVEGDAPGQTGAVDNFSDWIVELSGVAPRSAR
jgi:hypothetical protein